VDFSKWQHPSRGSGLIGKNLTAPAVVVAANGGIDLVYIPSANATEFVGKMFTALMGAGLRERYFRR